MKGLLVLVLLAIGQVEAASFYQPGGGLGGLIWTPFGFMPQSYLLPQQTKVSPSPPVSPSMKAPVAPEFAPIAVDTNGLGVWCKSLMEEAEAARLRLTSASKTSKAEVLRLWNVVDITLGNAGMLASLLKEVSPDETIRSTATNCTLAVNELATRISLDLDLYRVSQSVENDTARDVIDQRKYDRTMRTFRRSGVSLSDAAARQKVQDLSNEIDTLSTQFELNLSKDTRYVERSASDAAALAGLSEDFVTARTVDGKVRISTDYPDLQPTLKFAENEDLRKELFRTYHQRGLPDNLEILQKVLTKRHEKAVLLGYRSWAHYSTEVLMMGSETHADEFLNEVVQLARNRSATEIAEMLTLKQEGGVVSDTIYGFDSSFYSEKVRRANYQIDSNEIHLYFRYNNTRDGVIRLAENMFGVKFVRNPAVLVWHPDVETYDITWASGGDSIGRIFLDMFPRPNKYKHAAQFPVRSGVRGVQVPEGALVCNFPKTGPMEHSQVTTFFHEFGHLMHHIIGGQEQRYAEFSGVATEWDFVEAPSQMLENWAYDLATLQTFAKHETSGEPIPATLVQKLKNAETFGRGVNGMQQSFYAKLSLHLHMSDPTTMNVTDILLKTQTEYAPFPHEEGTNLLAGFGHLMGYSAVYFTYLWSQAIAQHLLVTFKSSGSLTNPDVSLRYRDLVLLPGGTRDAHKLVYDFSNKPLDLEAFHAWLQHAA